MCCPSEQTGGVLRTVDGTEELEAAGRFALAGWRSWSRCPFGRCFCLHDAALLLEPLHGVGVSHACEGSAFGVCWFELMHQRSAATVGAAEMKLGREEGESRLYSIDLV